MYTENDFQDRLSKLRIEKGVSARDMSLSLGQNAGYINNIENGKGLPSLNSFFYMCDYLGITPNDFFDIETAHPQTLNALIEYLKLLDEKQLTHITEIVKDIIQTK